MPFAFAIFVAIIAQRMHLPYTVGLVVAGIGLALTRIDIGITFTHTLIYDVILPPLLFEAAINIHWKELRSNALPVFVLETLGVIIFRVCRCMRNAISAGMALASSVDFGILIAATDSVSIIAMLKETSVYGTASPSCRKRKLFE